MLFDDFFEEILSIEGGYTDNPNDSGGITNHGITEATALKHGYTGDMNNIPLLLVRHIYRYEYWERLKLHEIDHLYPGLCMKLADIGVNMGVTRAGVFLQRLLNVLNNKQKYYKDISIDGAVGNVTIATLRSFMNYRGPDGEIVLVRGLNCMQGDFYVNLAEKREKDEAFIYGWLLNRID